MAIEEDAKLAAPESSPEATTDVPAESSPADQGAVASESPATEPASAPEKAEETPPVSEREALIAQLTGAAPSPDDAVEEPAEAPEASATTDEKTEAPQAASTEPATPDVLSEDELVAPVDKHTKPQTRKRIEALIADRKAKLEEIQAIKPLADYGKSVLDLCKTNNLTPEDFGAWFAFGAAVNSDPAKAPSLMLAEAERMARNVNVPLPKAGPDPALIQDLEDFVVDGMASMELSGDTAKKLLEKIRNAKKTAAPVAPPPAPVVQQTAPQVQTPTQQADPYVASATRELNDLHAKYAKAYPADWDKIRPEVHESMKRYTGTDPRHWARFFEQEVERVKAKFVVPRKPTIPKTLRPTTDSTPKPIPDSKAALLAELTGRA